MALCNFVDGCHCVSVDHTAFRKMGGIRFLRNFGARLPDFRASHSERIAMTVTAVRNTFSARLMLRVTYQHLFNYLNQIKTKQKFYLNRGLCKTNSQFFF